MKYHLILLSFLLFLACQQKSPSSQNDQSKTTSPILASVNGRVITQVDLETHLARYPANYFSFQGMKENLLNELIERELMLELVSERNIKENIAFQKELELYRENLLIDYLIQSEVTNLGGITEDNIKEFYEEHKEEFIEPARVKISVIQLKEKNKAEELLRKVKTGEDFVKLAQENSINITSQYGGNLGYIEIGGYIPGYNEGAKRIEEAAFALTKSGQLSSIIIAENTFNILRLEEYIKEGIPPLEKIHNQIYNILLQDRQIEALENMLTKLREEAHIETYPERF